jgi:hypothetical protein
VKSRASIEIIVGAVTGPITQPQSIVAGLYRDGIPCGTKVIKTAISSRTAQAAPRLRFDTRDRS